MARRNRRPAAPAPATAPSGAGRGTDPAAPQQPAGTPTGGVSRRALLATGGGAAALGLVVGTGGALTGARAVAGERPTPLSAVGEAVVPFHGRHQPGITTPAQAHGHLLGFDLVPAPAADARRAAGALLRRWTELAAALMAGEPGERDTGVALDAGPSGLTVTIGFGHSFFDATGLVERRPRALRPLPDFSADALDRERSDGDLWVAVGADDALVAFHALRAVQRAADESGAARLRWQHSGFNRAPGATASPMTARNLMGQVDGTNNPREADEGFAGHVFVPDPDGPGAERSTARAEEAWMAGGSYVVMRRIRMLLDQWEQEPLAEQEAVIGRRKADGAPLTGGEETTPVDLDARTAEGAPVIAANAHVRVSAPESNDGATMLRRPFSYHDGFRDDGAPDAGLLFLCWQADPYRAFVPVQRKLDRGDALSPFLRHEASALFAVPPGAAKGEYVGQGLLQG
ncbi:iron uptake transporter deferrochelatase/peroxidase subunit [Streptomyces bohaiensis]|uniref:iron uptake transporter deferrochelatase/peroxidase subunit n=1 Tax=Streptomyces bohaiensis TaxID=1431344 RepID=UPI003B800D65